MEVDDSYYYYGPSPPPPGAGAVAAQVMTSVLQQTAMAQEAARYALNEAHIARILQAQHTEAQRMVIPEAIRQVHHNTITSILKKTRAAQPVTPAPPAAIDQIANVDLSNSDGAAIAHARAGGDASTLLERIIDTTAPARSAASKVLRKLGKRAFMASAGAAVTALKASTTKGVEVAAPAPAVIRAKAAPAQPTATPAPPSVEQPVTAHRPRARAKARAITKAVAPPVPIDIPEPEVTTLAVSRGARRKREDVQLRKEEQQQKRPRPAPVMGGSRKRKDDDRGGTAIKVAPEPRIRQAPPQAPAAAVAAIEDTRKNRDPPAIRTSANAGGGDAKKPKRKWGMLDRTTSRNRE